MSAIARIFQIGLTVFILLFITVMIMAQFRIITFIKVVSVNNQPLANPIRITEVVETPQGKYMIDEQKRQMEYPDDGGFIKYHVEANGYADIEFKTENDTTEVRLKSEKFHCLYRAIGAINIPINTLSLPRYEARCVATLETTPAIKINK